MRAGPSRSTQSTQKKKRYDEITQRLKPPSGPELKCADIDYTFPILDPLETSGIPVQEYGNGGTMGRLWTTESCAGIVPVQNFPLIAQGSAPYERNGRQIMLKKVAMNLCFTNARPEAIQDCFIRVLILIDFQYNKVATLALSEVLKDSNLTGATTFFSQRNMDNSTRFKTLVDEIIRLDTRGRPIALDSGDTISDLCVNSSNVGVMRQYYFRMNLPITFDNSNGSSTSLTGNGIRMYAYAVSTQDGASNTFIILPSYNIRCRFVDA